MINASRSNDVLNMSRKNHLSFVLSTECAGCLFKYRVRVLCIYWQVSPLLSGIINKSSLLGVTGVVEMVVSGLLSVALHCAGRLWLYGGILLWFWVRFSVSSSSSYLHCQWASVDELDKDKRIQQKIKRFKAKQGQNKFLSEVRFVCFFLPFRYLRNITHSCSVNKQKILNNCVMHQ